MSRHSAAWRRRSTILLDVAAIAVLLLAALRWFDWAIVTELERLVGRKDVRWRVSVRGMQYHQRRCGHARSPSPGLVPVRAPYQAVEAVIRSAEAEDHFVMQCRVRCDMSANCIGFTVLPGRAELHRCMLHEGHVPGLLFCLDRRSCFKSECRTSVSPQLSLECSNVALPSGCVMTRLRLRANACNELKKLGGPQEKRIFWVSSLNLRNSGDVYAQALFGTFPTIERMLVARLDISWNAVKEAAALCLMKNDIVIVGGGGLLHHSKQWTANLFTYCQLGTCVLWAPGLNRHHLEMRGRSQAELAREDLLLGAEKTLIELAAASSLRDFNNQSFKFDSMLDASCLLPHFDSVLPDQAGAEDGADQCAIKRTVGWYLHQDSQTMTVELYNRFSKAAVMYNDVSLGDALRFICSSATVFAQSYHGVLWAHYLGTPVLTVGAFSEKFLGLPFAVRAETLNSAEQLLDTIGGAAMPSVLPAPSGSRKLLEDCRLANIKFHNDKLLPLLGLSESKLARAVEDANTLVVGGRYNVQQMRHLHAIVAMSSCTNCDL